MVRVTLSVAGSITLIDAPCLLLTHSRPFAVRAIERGAAPTVISASLARVTVSKALTLSLSWFTTHSRGLPAAGVSTSTLLDALGWFAVAGRYTVCRKLRLSSTPRSSVTINVTTKMPPRV